MIKKAIGLLVVVALGLFGYYFFTDNTLRTNQQKAQDAGRQVMGTLKDAGVEGLVKAALLQSLGYENSRYLHTTNDDGHVVVYGMTPPGVDPARIQAEVQKIAGVTDVEVALSPLTPQLAARRGVTPPPAQP